MARLFVFGIGGTGSRVLKAFTMLLASGMKPGHFDTVIPILIDPHKRLPDLRECKKLVRLYSKINEQVYRETADLTEGFFITKMQTLKAASTDGALRDDIEFDEEHDEAFGDFINMTGIHRKSPGTMHLLSLLYSDSNFRQSLSVGFKGNPHMGSMALNELIGGPAYNAFKSVFSNGDRIFVISSVFGGTGAAGFPLLLQNFRQSDKPEIKNSPIGALSVMPYFKLSEPGQTSDIDSNDFMTKTKSALTYYARREFTTLFDSIYYIADPGQQTDPYKNDESRQDNKAHLVELIGALSIFHFASASPTRRGMVYEYCLTENKKQIDFGNVGNPGRTMMADRLTSLHLFSKLHPVIRKNAAQLSLCKLNDFTEAFFNSEDFTDNEHGLELFLSQYHKWISELEANQRSFSPFDLGAGRNFSTLIRSGRNTTDRHLFNGIFKRPSDMSDLLNRTAMASGRNTIKRISGDRKLCRYFLMCYQGTGDFIDSVIKKGKA